MLYNVLLHVLIELKGMSTKPCSPVLSHVSEVPWSTAQKEKMKEGDKAILTLNLRMWMRAKLRGEDKTIVTMPKDYLITIEGNSNKLEEEKVQSLDSEFEKNALEAET
jgi:hypothetical protein